MISTMIQKENKKIHLVFPVTMMGLAGDESFLVESQFS